jgi:hypothetical protein
MLRFIALFFIISFFNSENTFAIIGGVQDPDPKYSSIGSLGEANNKSIICTATLISEDWIVTAQHCREGGSEEDPILYKPEHLYFKLGENAISPIKKVKLKRWIDAPSIEVIDSNGEKILVSLDVGFAQLSKPVKDIKIKPIRISTNALSDFINSEFEIVGYGVATTDGFEPSGLRKKARMAITSLQGNAFLNLFKTPIGLFNYLKTNFPGEEESSESHLNNAALIAGHTAHIWDALGRNSELVSAKPLQGFSDSCYGDSGGPLLKIKDNELQLVGIVSKGFRGQTMSCVPIGTIVSLFGTQLQEIMKHEGITKL